MANRTKLMPNDKESLTDLDFSGEHSSNLQTGMWKQTAVDPVLQMFVPHLRCLISQDIVLVVVLTLVLELQSTTTRTTKSPYKIGRGTE